MHLTETELIEHLEGALRPERVAHLASCERCGRQADTLAAALDAARIVEVPDPSPLFWDHFSAGVREAIDAPPASGFTGWGAFRGPGLALAGATITVLLVIAAFWQREVEAPLFPTVAPDSAAELAVDRSIETDPEWTFVAAIADGIDWDAAGAAGLGVGPGAAERAALRLSHDEQAELTRLLLEAMSGHGSL
jgi:hypothetical protein